MIVATTIVYHSALLCMILVATVTFSRDCRHCALPWPERHAVLKGSYDARGRHTHPRRSGYCGNAGKCARTCVRCRLANRPFAPGSAAWDLCVVVVAVVIVHEGQFFLKSGARHRASDMRIKISCVGIRFSLTTVVTTVV